MWIMIITFIVWSELQESGSTATIATAEFSSKASCEAARTAYLGQVKQITDPFNDLANNRWKQGSAGRHAIECTALCVQK
jgi:hypothetical protein